MSFSIVRWLWMPAMVGALMTAGFSTTAEGRIATSRATVPTATDTLTTEFTVNGLPVILRRNTANEVIGASLYFLGGTQQLTPQTQGIEEVLLAASERGTQHYPGAAMRTKTARLGTEIGVSTSKDWTVFTLHTIRTTFDSSWALLADRVMHPTLAAADVDLIREQILSGLRTQDSDPDQLVERLADSLMFTGHPYGLDPGGTVSSIQAMTIAQLKDYQRTTFVTSRMRLVVVGNVDRASLEMLVQATLGTLPKGTYTWKPPAAITDTSRALAIRKVKLPTNYVLGYYAGPSASSADYAALRLASAVLSGRFFTEIRSKMNLSYAPEAPFLDQAIATGGVYVTTIDPNTSLTIMRREIDNLQRNLISSDGLEQLVQQFVTDYFLKNETNLDQANFLARAAIYQGDYRKADQFVDELRHVTPQDVRRVARQYIRNFRFAYVGDPDRLDKAILGVF